jgi:hypothetical protein
MTAGEELSRLLRAERAARPPEQALARGWERLADTLRAAPLAAAPAATPALKVGWSLVTKWMLFGAVIGGLGAAAGTKLLTPPREPPANWVQPVSVSAAPPLPSTALAPSTGSTPVPAAVAPAVSSAGIAALPNSAPAPTGSAQATFDEELRLITLAKRELDSGRSHLARAWLAEHTQRFPGGVFAIDRDALNLLASCGEGERNEAALRRFRELHPQSPLLSRLERACGAGPLGAGSARPAHSADAFPQDR